MHWPKNLLKLFIIYLTIHKYSCEYTPTVTSTTTTSTTTILQTTTPLDLMNDLVQCDTHENCSSRIFSLDTYCCQSTLICCNWFQYTTTYHSTKTVSLPTLPFRAPSLLTILLILILFVCLLFVSYCFSILFCFCFKCGLFKHPKVILINSDSLPNTESGLTTADLIISPKHSTTSSASSSSSLNYSNRNRRKHSNSNPSRSKRLAKSTSSRSTRQSPTARVYSNHSRRNNSNYQRTSQSDLYIEYESNSPFLIPPHLAASKRSNRTRNTGSTSNTSASNNHQVPSFVQPSAPLALDDFNLNSIQHDERLIPSPTSSIESLTEAIEMREHTSQRITENIDDLNQQALYLDEKPPSYDVAVAAYQSLEFFNNNNNNI